MTHKQIKNEVESIDKRQIELMNRIVSLQGLQPELSKKKIALMAECAKLGHKMEEQFMYRECTVCGYVEF